MAETTEKKDPETTEPAADALKPVVKLRFPIEFEGRKVETIELDFMRIKGSTQRAAEQRYIAAGGVPGAGRASDGYCIFIAAEAAGMAPEAFDELIGPDFTEVVLLVQNFLLDSPWMQEQATR